ncbi:hypothetical protein LB533_13905 [Mesorhizobium sp. BR1-1-13]|uniref:hypothetical protein n=1 Tax=Mesorhizobium sp. BR1-1-13 TaxID=2876656 RepID=UPI001CD14CBF|nr:hypothetical protein [Mesorhizobium sp. BR1-1-13]MBZ9942196.1 hypothetical protein [Mesorhizobium sp. BR1-1-13]
MPGRPGEPANQFSLPDAKAMVEDAKTAPSTAPADVAIGAGIGGGGVAGTLTDLQNQLSPLSYANEWITRVVVVLAIGSAVLVFGGAAYR